LTQASLCSFTRFPFALLKSSVSATIRDRFYPMRRAFSFILVLLALAPALLAQPRFRNAGATLIAEDVTNKVVEAGELVTVGLALKNVGDAVASNLIATISGSGVSDPQPQSQSYGLLAPCAPSVMRDFTFTANGEPNALLFVNLDLEDSGRDLGTVTFRFRIGPQTTIATNSGAIVIQHGMATPFPSVINIVDAPGSIAKVSVTLSNLTHTFPDDLDILLVSPNGESVMLMSDAGGGTDMLDRSYTFSDDAQQLLPDVGLPPPGAYKPTNHGSGDVLPPPAPMGPYAAVMSAFNGRYANGDWKLFVWDDGAPDDGLLRSGWSLTITTLQPVDAAPTLTFLGRSTNDMIRFSVSGRPSRSYAIETSPDPVQAFPLETFIMPTSGTKTFEFPLESEDRFFRAVTDP
jgi:subtilisin-like proprotein convertase family protein